MAVHTSPAILKQRVGTSRTYIRPVLRDLDLTPIVKKIDVVNFIIHKCYNYSYKYIIFTMYLCLIACGGVSDMRHDYST